MSKYTARHAATRPKASSKHMATAPQGDVRPSHRGRKVFGVTLAIVVGLGGVAYGAGLYYFRDHFLPNTTVNGRNVSLMGRDQVADEISSSTDGYRQTITAGGFGLTVTASDIGLVTDGDAAADEALSQVDVYQWPYLALRGTDLEVTQGVSYDRDKLSELVGAAVDAHNAEAEQPQDATWTYDQDSGAFEVKPEVEGDVVDRDTVVAAATEGVDALSDATTCDTARVEPSRRSDDATLQGAVEQANAMVSATVPLTYQGTVKASVGHDQLASWVSIGDDLSVTIDQDAVASYVATTVAPAVRSEDEDNTYSVAKRDLTGRLVSSIEASDGESVEIPVTKTAKPKKAETSSTDTTSNKSTSSGSYEAGLGSYVDVDLSNQYARLYDASGNVLWSSNIVSGNSSEDRSTPTGTYAINAKSTDVTLVGADEDGDGEPDYKSHVTYWMPFIGNSVGLHDATWRGSFGGSIYQTDGSHGCVNLPYAKASELYGLVSVGTTVRVHY